MRAACEEVDTLYKCRPLYSPCPIGRLHRNIGYSRLSMGALAIITPQRRYRDFSGNGIYRDQSCIAEG
jgi:hypothetical protein